MFLLNAQSSSDKPAYDKTDTFNGDTEKAGPENEEPFAIETRHMKAQLCSRSEAF